jgi:thiol-disulfide isomerase/thioredoxin
VAERFDLSPADAASPVAPPWTTTRWFNLPAGRDTLAPQDLRGRVVVLHAFQMLCPGCVHHGLPQAQRIAAAFAPADVVVVGLHTVFEHHAAMTPVSLEAFLFENRIRFPVGVDAPADAAGDPLPQTMRRYAWQGTPSLVLIDRQGRLRRSSFGAEEDLVVGAAIATLVAEPEE